MNEGTLKNQLVKRLEDDMPGAVVLRHEELFRSGIPDMSVTWNGKTTWWEAKLADPNPRGKGIQKLTASRLAEQGRCYYIIWVASPGPKRTLIVEPKHVLIGDWDHPFVFFPPTRLNGWDRAEWPDYHMENISVFIKGIHEYDYPLRSK